jgi:glyoxylase-like metal-dependent hydrolase (beta-lactamase superfamily II)
MHGGIRVGEIEIALVCEGYAPLALADEFPGTEIDWAAERAAYPWAFHDEASWAWHVHAFALRTADGVVMVDAGLGAFPPFRPWASSTPRERALAAAGVDANEVVAVAHTHLHADHAGGAVVEGEPRFANATHHVHPADWSAFADRDDGEDYTARHAMEELERQGMLELRADDHDVATGVHVVWTPGHTPGHRSVLVRSDEETLLLTGDALHTPTQVRLPGASSSHDEAPDAACASRERLVEDAARHGWTVGVTHFAHPFGTVDEGGWRSAG